MMRVHVRVLKNGMLKIISYGRNIFCLFFSRTLKIFQSAFLQVLFRSRFFRYIKIIYKIALTFDKNLDLFLFSSQIHSL